MAKNENKRRPSAKRTAAPRARRSGSAISLFTFYLNRRNASPAVRRKVLTRLQSEPHQRSDDSDELGSCLA
jgi:hypothetical protein